MTSFKSQNSFPTVISDPDDVTSDELSALEAVVNRLRCAREAVVKISSPGSSGTQSDLLCTICYARPADTAFMPCGHHSCRCVSLSSFAIIIIFGILSSFYALVFFTTMLCAGSPRGIRFCFHGWPCRKVRVPAHIRPERVKKSYVSYIICSD